MERTPIVLTAAVLIAMTAYPSPVAARSYSPSPSAQARATLRQIEESSSKLGDDAFVLKLKAEDTQHDRDSQLAGLMALKEGVNQIGDKLKVLEAERPSLEPWEAAAVNQVVPLMHQVAADVTRAIETFNSDGTHLWASPYGGALREAGDDAGKVATILKDRLQLARAREKEHRLERELSSPAGM